MIKNQLFFPLALVLNFFILVSSITYGQDTDNLKKVFTKSILNKFAYKILQNDLKIFKDQINPDKYNGATLIGVNGISVKSHGSASPLAFSYAISRCNSFIKSDFNNKIREKFNNI